MKSAWIIQVSGCRFNTSDLLYYHDASVLVNATVQFHSVFTDRRVETP